MVVGALNALIELLRTYPINSSDTDQFNQTLKESLRVRNHVSYIGFFTFSSRYLICFFVQNQKDATGSRNICQTKICHNMSICILYFAEDVRSSGTEITSSYEQLPVLECEGFKDKFNSLKSQKMYQAYKGKLTKLNITKLLQRSLFA